MSNQVATITRKDLSLASDLILNDKQAQLVLKSTPAKYLKKRPAKGGGTWEYVSVSYVQKCLNLMFGWDWDFEILDEKVLIDAGEVVVKGRLVCRTDGRTIVKTQFGNKDIMFRKGTKTPLSIGNDLKAAASDSLKKCASLIGIAQDVYGKEDFKEVQIAEVPNENEEEKRLQKHIDKCTSLNELNDLRKKVSADLLEKMHDQFEEKRLTLTK